MRAIAQCPLCSWVSPTWSDNRERADALRLWDEHRDAYHRPVPDLVRLSEED